MSNAFVSAESYDSSEKVKIWVTKNVTIDKILVGNHSLYVD